MNSQRKRCRGARSSFHRCIEALEARRLLSIAPLGDPVLFPDDQQALPSAGFEDMPAISTGPNGTSLLVWEDNRSSLAGVTRTLRQYFGTNLGNALDIYAARIDAQGNLLDSTPIVVCDAPYYQERPAVAWNGSHWLVAWYTEREDNRYAQEIHAIRVAPDGTVVDASPIVIAAPTTTDWNGNPVNPQPVIALASDGDNFAALWWRTSYAPNFVIEKEFRVSLIAADGTISDPDGEAVVVGDQFWQGNSLAWGGSSWLMTYQVTSGVTHAQRFDAALNPLGSSFVVDPDAAGANLAGSPDGWLATWRRNLAATYDLYGRRIDSNGAFIDAAPFLIEAGSSQISPSIAADWTGQDWLVTYTAPAPGGFFNQDIFGLRVPAMGVVGTRFDVAVTPEMLLTPRIAGTGNGGANVVFTHRLPVSDVQKATHVDAANATTAPVEVMLAAPRQTFPALADNGDGFLAIFTSASAQTKRILAYRVDHNGVVLDDTPVVVADESWNAQRAGVAFNGSEYLAVFQVGANLLTAKVYGRRLGLDAQPIGPAFEIMDGFHPVVAANGSTFLVVSAFRPSTQIQSVRAIRVDGGGSILGAPTLVQHNHARFPDVAAVGNRWLITWQQHSSHDQPRSSISAAFINADGTTPGSFAVHSSILPGNELPTIASAGNEALIVWQQDITGTTEGDDLMARRIDADGTFLSPSTKIIEAPGVQASPEAAFDGSNYVITWVDTRATLFPHQQVADVYGAIVATDMTVLTPGGFVVAEGRQPQQTPMVAATNGGAIFAYAAFHPEAPYASFRIETRTSVPVVLESGFDVDAPRQQIFLRFSEDVSASISAASFTVLNLDTSQPIPTSQLQVIYGANDIVAVRYLGDPQGILPDGNYRVTLAADAVTDAVGNPLPADHVFDFAFLQADANGDGVVNLADFNILAANFGQSGKTFSEGNFDYDPDGLVNLADFNILASRFGVSLPAGTTAAGHNAFAESGGGRVGISGSLVESDEDILA